MKKITFMTVGVVLIVLILGVLILNGRRKDGTRLAWAEEKSGENIYQENCAACHGERGDGKGPEANGLKTKPRNFTSGIYKFRSTTSGSLPSDQDIFGTITRGVRGTSMLAQLHLSEQERWEVVHHLKTLSVRFKQEKPRQIIAIPPAPSLNPKLIALGKTKYEEAGCAQCHGPDGKGDGPSAAGLKDEWGEPITPTDLTRKPFKSGPEPEDLYRTVSNGLNGTPMPSYENVLAPKERWSLVFYILSIATKERPRGMMGLVGEEVEGMRIDMKAAMAGMMKGGGMMRGRGGMMNGDMKDMMRK
jgi:cytochrome c oxidase cbb3-type subunit I/II